MRRAPPEPSPGPGEENGEANPGQGRGTATTAHVRHQSGPPGYVADADSPGRMIAAMLCVLALAGLAVAVLQVPALTSVDADTLNWLASHRAPWATAVMLAVTMSSGPSVTSVYAALLVVMCFLRRQRRLGLGVALVAYGGMILNVGVKHLVHRPRPDVARALQTLETYSFPSGHAAAVTVFGALLVSLLSSGPPRMRAGVVIAVLSWIVLAGTSRLYLGAHYPSDVLAGVVEGFAWVLLAAALLQHWRVRLVWCPTTSTERYPTS